MTNLAPGWPDSSMLEAAWGIIANAGGSNWELETSDWQEAAARWRDAYHRSLDADPSAQI